MQLWESNFPKYLFSQVHLFLEIIHFCQAFYVPSQRAIVSLDQQVLFSINAESINQMFQIQLGPNETRISVKSLLELYTKLDLPKKAQIFQNFIIEESHTPIDSPPYCTTIFSERGKQIITILFCILGYTTDEHVDEVVLAFLSIFFPSKPPATVYNFSQFIADRIHEEFNRLPNERVFKYSSLLFHMFLYFHSDKFLVSIQKLDTKGNPRFFIFWTPLIQIYSTIFLIKSSFIHLFIQI